jgi:hypothetical protein
MTHILAEVRIVPQKGGAAQTFTFRVVGFSVLDFEEPKITRMLMRYPKNLRHIEDKCMRSIQPDLGGLVADHCDAFMVNRAPSGIP